MTSDILLSKLDLDKDWKPPPDWVPPPMSPEEVANIPLPPTRHPDTQMSPEEIANIPLPPSRLPDKRLSHSVIHSNSDASCSSLDKNKIPRTDTKPGSVNGTWKKKYLVSTCHNASCSAANNSQASGENSLNCIRFQNFPNKKKLSRKDSLNVNISTRKDGQVIIGR